MYLTFKLLFGEERNLPHEIHGGHMYYCTDTGHVFFDFDNGSGGGMRAPVTAITADMLRYFNDGVETRLRPKDIATKADLEEAIKDVAAIDVVSSKDEMVDEGTVYIYSGSEPGMVSGALYYFDSDDSVWKAVSSGSGSQMPSGGTVGQVLMKNSNQDGDASWQDLPAFDGLYTITPKIGADIMMQTSQKYLDRNIEVKEIPVYVTGNDSGGNTVIIGG